MATSQSSSSETLTLNSTQLFLDAHNSLSQEQQQLQPLSLSLLSSHSSLPPIPSDFPQSKLIPRTRFVVDAFKYSGDHSVSYFLSHFHSDHYTGLTPNWSKGIVFCSQTTAHLLVEVLKIPALFVVPLKLSEPVLIDGCEVVLIDANHCPGAVQFLFKIPSLEGKFERYVHTGDFRFCNSMKLEPLLSEFIGSDAIFLDTTYCNPKFVFPSQEESIDYIVSAIDKTRVENEGLMKSVLFLVATYVIGKEKILLEISRRCRRKVHVGSKKMAVLRVLGYGENEVFTEDELESDVHVVGWNVLGETWPYFRPNFVRVKEMMVAKGYSKVVGFVPTGWTYEVKHKKFSVRKKDSFEIHLVPYSEHSNYDELREYVKFLKPKHVIPTVGFDVEKLDGKHTSKMNKHFSGLVDEMANKQEFLMGFHRGSREREEKVEKYAEVVQYEGMAQEQEVKPSEMEVVKIDDPERFSGPPSTLEEPNSRDTTVLNDEEMEEIIQQLRDCLPIWVTQTQILDLLNNFGRNIVEAVSHFYECETEFFEQVARSTSVSTSQTSSLNDSASPSNPSLLKSSPLSSVKVPQSQDQRLPNKMPLIKNRPPHGKRKKTKENKRNKKVKSNSYFESSGSKQSTITRFFSKLGTNVSQGDDSGTKFEQCQNGDTSLPANAIKLYNEEINKFMQIINGSESSRSCAATILEKTKGDINMALNIYYSTPGGDFGKNEETLVACSKSVQNERSVDICSTIGEEVEMPEESGQVVRLSKLGLSSEKGAINLVSLPPEKYSPVEHACWTSGQPAPYMHLARTFDLVEGEKGKIKVTSMLCNMFRSLLALSPEDVLPAVYLCTNKIAADHENMELNIGGGLVTTALEEACGTNRSKIKDLYNSLGDLGDVAQVCRQTQTLLAPPPPLLIKDVLSVLRKISVQTGTGSTNRKKSLIVNLMRSCREKEIKFLTRTLEFKDWGNDENCYSRIGSSCFYEFLP